MKRPLVFILIFLILSIVGCHRDKGNTSCCDNHGGVAMCYRATGASHGHIMCRDGKTCLDECY